MKKPHAPLHALRHAGSRSTEQHPSSSLLRYAAYFTSDLSPSLASSTPILMDTFSPTSGLALACR